MYYVHYFVLPYNADKMPHPKFKGSSMHPVLSHEPTLTLSN